MSEMRTQTAALMGKRLMVHLLRHGLVETSIDEISPAGKYIKLHGVGWVEQGEVKHFEVLPPLPKPEDLRP